MILTVTPNPSIDATLHLSSEVEVGGVNRAASGTSVAGGKGINVARVLHLAGTPVLALFPSSESDPFLRHLAATDLPFETLTVGGSVRVNTTLTEPGGRTTKINGPGPELTEGHVAALVNRLTELAADADAVVLAGSLPPGVPEGFYVTAIAALTSTYPGLIIAVDTSDNPLRALGAGFATAAPTIIKPNGFELGQLAGVDGFALERDAENGDFGPVLEAAARVVAQGVSDILVTLGGAGALLVTADGAWRAAPAPITVRSTVGAGDSSLAGYLLARIAGKEPPESLRTAVAYGTAAAALPGTDLPSPDQLNVDGVTVTPLPLSPVKDI